MASEKAKKNYWKDIQRCRAFFEEFAIEQNFDHNNPENWYKVSLSDMAAKRVTYFWYCSSAAQLILD